MGKLLFFGIHSDLFYKRGVDRTDLFHKIHGSLDLLFLSFLNTITRTDKIAECIFILLFDKIKIAKVKVCIIIQLMQIIPFFQQFDRLIYHTCFQQKNRFHQEVPVIFPVLWFFFDKLFDCLVDLSFLIQCLYLI